MTDQIPELQPSTARKVFIWQLIFFAALFALAAAANIFTVIADHARRGHALPVWEPSVWEISSVLVEWALVPGVAWWLKTFPLIRARWWPNLPAHLLGLVCFSVSHTFCMVALRKLAYRLMGEHYEFGPYWLYELRKDALTYFLIVCGLMAFHTYGLWLDMRGQRQAATGSTGLPLGRLVVRKRNREFILDAGDIDRVDADGNYVVVHAGGESYRLRDSLEGLARRLGEQRFARVHRAHVVNIDRIREIQPWDHGDYRIVLKDGSFVNFSRRYRSRLQHLFQ